MFGFYNQLDWHSELSVLFFRSSRFW